MRALWMASMVLFVSGCSCGDDCAGIACEPCPPAIQIDVRAPEAGETPAVSGPVELTCDARPGGWICHTVSAPVGRYTFEVSLAGASRTVTIELREGGEACCSCPTESAVGQVDFSGPADGGAEDADAGAEDAGAEDAGAEDGGSADAAAPGDAGRTDAGALTDGGLACDPSLVEVPTGGELEVGTLCDDVFACVPAAAVASIEASTVFDCTGVTEFSCGGSDRACRYADPAGPSTLDEAELANICALTVHAPPPSRVVCQVYL